MNIDSSNSWMKSIKKNKIDKKLLEEKFNLAEDQILINLNKFGTKFPSAVTVDNIYSSDTNKGWTEGFWIGQLWILWEKTKNPIIKKHIDDLLKTFRKRLDEKIYLSHHNIGILYNLSSVNSYLLDGNIESKNNALEASKYLTNRYLPNLKFIQAWGGLGSETDCKLVVDTILCIPYLFKLSKIEDDKKMFEIARNHIISSKEHLIRKNFTTYNTVLFDFKNSKKVRGEVFQGYSPDSCWARGQAKMIYGLALSKKYLGDEINIEVIKKVTNVYINALPKDLVPYWDLIFQEGSEMARDTSAGVIAICGIVELCKYLEGTEKEQYMNIALAMASSIMKSYINKKVCLGKPLLLHGVYNYHNKVKEEAGYDEGTLWGDYYYLELLMKLLNDNWEGYW